MPPGVGLYARLQFPRTGDPGSIWPINGDEAVGILGDRCLARIREDLKSWDGYPHIRLAIVVAPVGEVHGTPYGNCPP